MWGLVVKHFFFVIVRNLLPVQLVTRGSLCHLSSMEVQAAAKKAARETAEAEGAAVVQWLLSVWALSLVVAFLPAL